MCYKEDNNNRTKKYYRNTLDKSKRCNEPIKKKCTECDKSFWTGRYRKLVCSKECGRLRKNRLAREERKK